MLRAGILVVAAALLAAAFAPVASAHIPDGPGPNVNYWITCGQTPSTWPGCAIDDARVWCASQCIPLALWLVQVALHCIEHALDLDLLCPDVPA